MATTDSERYVRLTLLTHEGGTWISKKILLREVDALPNRPGLVAFLRGHKPHFKVKKNHHDLSAKQYRILFPTGGVDTDIEEWDLQLLIKVILDLFNASLTQQESSDLKEILRIRNDVICHARQPAISEQDFFAHWTLLVGCIYSLSSFLDSVIARQAIAIIDSFRTGPLSLQTSLDKLSALCRNDEHMDQVLESLAGIARRQNSIEARLSSHDIKFAEILDRLTRIERFRTPSGTGTIDIPSLKTQLCISCDRDQLVKSVEEFVKGALEAVIKKVNNPDDDERIKDALREMLDEIEGMDCEARSVKLGSIYLDIQCYGIGSLKCILGWFLRTNNCQRLQKVESALSAVYGEPFNVCLTLPEESKIELLDWTAGYLPRTESIPSAECLTRSESTSSDEFRAKTKVNLGIKCHSSEAVARVVEYFRRGDASNKLNKLSETLSSVVGETIRVDATLDLDQFLTALKQVEADMTIQNATEDTPEPAGKLPEKDTGDTDQKTDDIDTNIDDVDQIRDNVNNTIDDIDQIKDDIEKKSGDTDRKTEVKATEIESVDQKMDDVVKEIDFITIDKGSPKTLVKPKLTADSRESVEGAADLVAKPTAEIKRLSLADSKTRKELLEDIENFCKRYGPGERETVLLIGQPGVGKSAAINTIAKVVNGEYIVISKLEDESTRRTEEIALYKHCGYMPTAFYGNRHEENHAFKRIKSHLPHLIDYTAWNYEECATSKDILELLIGGFIPPTTAIATLRYYQNRYGVGCLKSIYSTAQPGMQVTKIVFVHSGLSSVPTPLINCLNSILAEKIEGSNIPKYNCDVYLLMTKYDKVDQCLNCTPDESSGTSYVSMEDFERIESTLARLLKIKGVSDRRRLRWTSYCSGIGYDSEHIDISVLNFLKYMVMPCYQRDLVDQASYTMRMRRKLVLALQETMLFFNLRKRDIFIVAIAVLTLLVLGWAMKAPEISQDPQSLTCRPRSLY